MQAFVTYNCEDMSKKRQSLLESIATTIADYRQSDITAINSDHVEQWVNQFGRFGFDKDAQIIILEQMNCILDKYYISRIKAQDFLTKVLTSQKLFGNNPAAMICNVKFLQIQTVGSSQNDLLRLSDQIIQNEYKLTLKNCGQSPVAYIYLDDCLFSGNRVRRDIGAWLPNAVKGTTLHLIFFAHHTDGYEYSKKIIEQQAQPYNITVRFWRQHEFHNRRWKPQKFDCFWANEYLEDEFINKYIQVVNERRNKVNKSLPPLFRPNDMPTEDNIFSSANARKIIDSAFLKVGSYIVSLPKNPNSSMRPLGYDYLETLGFGAFFVTYRNIANNCPLALWWVI